jgi:dTDP-4-dehydrorhamnose reductase
MPKMDGRKPVELWAGAECTLNRVGDRFKDQAALTGHNDRAADIKQFAQLGIRALRYPLLWETFAQCDDAERLWRWHDARLEQLRQLGIRPILGLLHHGSGPGSTDLLASDFSAGLANHAAVSAARYPWIEDWTPINEPLTTARFSALYGHWYPHVQDERAFWQALLNQIDGVRLSMQAIRAINPAARLIQTEDLGHTGSTPPLAGLATFYNQRRWATWDLLIGSFTDGHPLCDHVASLGLESRLTAIAQAPCPPDLIGINHYLTSDRYLDHCIERHPDLAPSGSHYGLLIDTEAVRVDGAHPGLEGAITDCWQRYGLPIALTEIHNGCTREEQMRWLNDACVIATKLRRQGLDVEAVTVWSLLGAFDWNSLLTRDEGHYETGVFDIRDKQLRETAMVPMIRQIAAGQRPDHPVLSAPGWWQKRSASSQSANSPNLVRPLLILGATGTLGQAFAGACRLRNIPYVLTGRAQIDLGCLASIESGLDDIKPWAVINCAGWVRVDDAEEHPSACMNVNFGGSIALARACERRDIHYTCFSSDLVFDGTSSKPYVETDALNPLGIYGVSKAKADMALAALDSRCLIVRTAAFFSPYDAHNFAVHLADRLRSGRGFAAAQDCITSPTYVPDLVRVTLDLVIDDDRGLRHLANDGAVSWAEFGAALADRLNLPIGLIEPRSAAEMGWAARRPTYAPLQSNRGQLLPSLDTAIANFAAHRRHA